MAASAVIRCRTCIRRPATCTQRLRNPPTGAGAASAARRSAAVSRPGGLWRRRSALTGVMGGLRVRREFIGTWCPVRTAGSALTGVGGHAGSGLAGACSGSESGSVARPDAQTAPAPGRSWQPIPRGKPVPLSPLLTGGELSSPASGPEWCTGCPARVGHNGQKRPHVPSASGWFASRSVPMCSPVVRAIQCTTPMEPSLRLATSRTGRPAQVVSPAELRRLVLAEAVMSTGRPAKAGRSAGAADTFRETPERRRMDASPLGWVPRCLPTNTSRRDLASRGQTLEESRLPAFASPLLTMYPMVSSTMYNQARSARK